MRAPQTPPRIDDRVLLLAIPEPSIVASLAAQLTRGLLVAIGSDDEITAARIAARDLDNVMFVPAAPEEIPWRDRFFTKAIAFGPLSDAARREVERVLVTTGELLTF